MFLNGRIPKKSVVLAIIIEKYSLPVIHVRMGLKPIAVRLRQTRSDARSQAEPGNEHWSEFALSLTAMGFSPMRTWITGILYFS